MSDWHQTLFAFSSSFRWFPPSYFVSQTRVMTTDWTVGFNRCILHFLSPEEKTLSTHVINLLRLAACLLPHKISHNAHWYLTPTLILSFPTGVNVSTVTTAKKNTGYKLHWLKAPQTKQTTASTWPDLTPLTVQNTQTPNCCEHPALYCLMLRMNWK